MSNIAELAVQLSMNAADFERGIGSALAKTEALTDKLASVGRTMTMGVTAPLVGAATAAIGFSTALNSGMANTASLGVTAERVNELKTNIQDMAISVGKDTADLSGGLYQVVSAFGDTADTATILEINARAAAAGLATTTDAINLTSATTKGYGDTTAAAVQHSADLAMMTVRLGQTTFPELAASMGAVVPIAASLGVAQADLFAVMATATGVTGGASEVATQLRGVLQSMMAPTESMTGLMNSLGYETGAAMLAGEGMQGAIEQIVAAADASGAPLQTYIGSIEGQTLALALAGPQADVFTEKLAAMQDVAGASDAAFAAQTQGINASGFAMTQMSIKATVLAQKVGDGLAPALAIVLDKVTPLIDGVVGLADSFATADTGTQTMIVGALALVAALGPILAMLPMIATAVGVLASPVGLVVAAVALLGAAWATNFGGIQEKTAAVGVVIQEVFGSIVTQITAATTAGGGMQTAFATVGTAMAPAFERLGVAFGGLGAAFGTLGPQFAGLGTSFAGLGVALQPLIDLLGKLAAAMGVGLVVAANIGVNLVAAAFENLPALLTPIIDQMTATINLIASTLTGVIALITALATGDWAGAWLALQGIVDGFIVYVTASWTNFTAMFAGLGSLFTAIVPPGWFEALTGWAWPTFDPPALLSALVAWAWPDFPSLPAILDTLMTWKWPSLSMPDWLDDLLSFKWPGFPALPTWLGGKEEPGNNARGTNFWRGGPTWVGEQGPELVSLPRGSKVYPNDLSMQMAGAAGGMQITVNANVASEMDIRQLAYQLASEFERWRR